MEAERTYDKTARSGSTDDRLCRGPADWPAGWNNARDHHIVVDQEEDDYWERRRAAPRENHRHEIPPPFHRATLHRTSGRPAALRAGADGLRQRQAEPDTAVYHPGRPRGFVVHSAWRPEQWRDFPVSPG